MSGIGMERTTELSSYQGILRLLTAIEAGQASLPAPLCIYFAECGLAAATACNKNFAAAAVAINYLTKLLNVTVEKGQQLLAAAANGNYDRNRQPWAMLEGLEGLLADKVEGAMTDATGDRDALPPALKMELIQALGTVTQRHEQVFLMTAEQSLQLLANQQEPVELGNLALNGRLSAALQLTEAQRHLGSALAGCLKLLKGAPYIIWMYCWPILEAFAASHAPMLKRKLRSICTEFYYRLTDLAEEETGANLADAVERLTGAESYLATGEDLVKDYYTGVAALQAVKRGYWGLYCASSQVLKTHRFAPHARGTQTPAAVPIVLHMLYDALSEVLDVKRELVEAAPPRASFFTNVEDKMVPWSTVKKQIQANLASQAVCTAKATGNQLAANLPGWIQDDALILQRTAQDTVFAAARQQMSAPLGVTAAATMLWLQQIRKKRVEPVAKRLIERAVGMRGGWKAKAVAAEGMTNAWREEPQQALSSADVAHLSALAVALDELARMACEPQHIGQAASALVYNFRVTLERQKARNPNAIIAAGMPSIPLEIKPDEWSAAAVRAIGSAIDDSEEGKRRACLSDAALSIVKALEFVADQLQCDAVTEPAPTAAAAEVLAIKMPTGEPAAAANAAAADEPVPAPAATAAAAADEPAPTEAAAPEVAPTADAATADDTRAAPAAALSGDGVDGEGSGSGRDSGDGSPEELAPLNGGSSSSTGDDNTTTRGSGDGSFTGTASTGGFALLEDLPAVSEAPIIIEAPTAADAPLAFGVYEQLAVLQSHNQALGEQLSEAGEENARLRALVAELREGAVRTAAAHSVALADVRAVAAERVSEANAHLRSALGRVADLEADLLSAQAAPAVVSTAQPEPETAAEAMGAPADVAHSSTDASRTNTHNMMPPTGPAGVEEAEAVLASLDAGWQGAPVSSGNGSDAVPQPRGCGLFAAIAKCFRRRRRS